MTNRTLAPALALALLASAAAAGPAADGQSVHRWGEIAFSPCTLKGVGTAHTVEARCGTFAVPEDHAQPDGRKIDLALAWVPAQTPSAAADPIVFLTGGPGQSARESYPGIADAFARAKRKRHVLLIDQRGTGGSNPLNCRDADGNNAFTDGDDDSVEAATRFAAACRAQLESIAELRHYTTSDAVTDLEAVRVALGAPSVNLVGVSYGTRVAQTYVRRYPERVRTVILDGVVPSELILGSEHAKNLEASLSAQFARCAKLPACAERFGDPLATLARLRAQLIVAPMPVRYRDPQSGEPIDGELTLASLAAVVRLFAYAPNVAAMLPRALHQAAHGEADVLAAQARFIGDVSGEQIFHGMQLSVMCAEDAPELSADPADASTLLGNTLIDFVGAQCSVWPRGERPADFHAPLSSDKPILVLSGEFDPVTPARYGDQVVRNFSAGRHLVARGTGHNVLPLGCMPRLAANFIDTADAKALDASCLDTLTYAPPFTGSFGPEP